MCNLILIPQGYGAWVKAVTEFPWNERDKISCSRVTVLEGVSHFGVDKEE